MRTVFHLVLGPYAEFAPPPQNAGTVPPETEDGVSRFADRLWCDFYPMFAGTPRGRYRYGPPCGPAGREAHWEGQPPLPELPDLAGVDPGAELRWFAREYRAELADVASHFGCPPPLRWGLLAW